MNNPYPYPCDDDGWKETENGNWTHIGPAEVVQGTVFLNRYGHWQIIVQTEFGGRLVADEFFKDPDAARHRAEAIFLGAPCKFLPIRNAVR